MKKALKKPLTIFSLAISIAIACLIFYKDNDQSSFQNLEEKQNQDIVNQEINEEAKRPEPEIQSTTLNLSEDDQVIGSPDAPITIIEYASLSCPHCANFHRDAFPIISKKYIETGKAKFIFRNFPLNQQALVGAMIARCHSKAGQNKVTKYYDMIKLLLKTQDSWAFSSNYIEKLTAIVKLNGMKSKELEECLLNKEIQESILQKRIEAAKNLKIKSTPSFFINGRAVSGYINIESIETAIEAELPTLN